MMIVSAPDWHEHVQRLRAGLGSAGIQIKAKSAQKLAARMAGFPHENAVYAALPIELSAHSGLPESLIQDLAVFHQEHLAPEQAQRIVIEIHDNVSAPAFVDTHNNPMV